MLDDDYPERRWIAGDFSGFDKMLSAGVMHSVFDILDELETSKPKKWKRKGCHEILDEAWLEEPSARQLIRRWIIESVHISKSFKYYTNGGNPSGNALTTVINSIAQLCLMRYALIKLTGSPKAPLAIYGDDSVMKSPDVDRVDQHTLSHFFARHNIVFTNASKDYTEDSEALLKSWEVEFLKRSFINPTGRQWWAPLRWQVIVDMPAYIRRADRNNMVVVKQIIDQTLREALLYGTVRWHELRSNINRALIEASYRNGNYLYVVLPSELECEMAYDAIAKMPNFYTK
jgi:hypothetical protein